MALVAADTLALQLALLSQSEVAAELLLEVEWSFPLLLGFACGLLLRLRILLGRPGDGFLRVGGGVPSHAAESAATVEPPLRQ